MRAATGPRFNNSGRRKPQPRTRETQIPSMTPSVTETRGDGPVEVKGSITKHHNDGKLVPVLRSAALLVVLFFVLCGTNRWLSFEEGIRLENATDTKSYMAIAATAPSLPPADAQLLSHHAQRFVSPYIVGTVAFYSHLSAQQVFRVAVIAMIALIIWVAYRILCHLRVPEQYGTLCMSLLILNPYMFRLYLAIPALLDDLVFVLGLSLLVYGLLQGRLGTAVIAALVASLGKQTSLFVLPVVAIWILFGPPWSRLSLARRTSSFLLIAVVCVTCYLVTGAVAREFSSAKSEGVYFMLTGLPRWALSEFNAGFLANFVFLGIFPFLFPLSIGCAVFLRTRPPLPKEFYLLIAMVLACCLQPFLAGPSFMGHGILRLNLLAYVPLLAALGLLLREARLPAHSESLMLVCGILIAVGSLHPRFTYNGGTKPPVGPIILGTVEPLISMWFVCLYCLSALLVGVAIYLSTAPAKE